MPIVPVTRQSTSVNIPTPTGPGQVQGVGDVRGQALKQAGQLVGEITSRLREQALQEQSVQLEAQAREQLAQAENAALESEAFRQAPDIYEQQARDIVNSIVQQADPVLQTGLQANLGEKVAISKAELRRKTVRKSQQNQTQAFRNFSSQLGTDFAGAETPQSRQSLLTSLREKAQGLVESGAALPEEAEALYKDAEQNAFEARVHQLISDKKSEDAAAFVKESGLPPDRKRVLLSLAENQTRQNSRELGSYVSQVGQFVSDRGELPSSVAGVPYTELQKRVEGTEFGNQLARIERNLSEVRGHAQLPVGEQVRRLEEIRETTNTPEQNERLKLLSQVTSRAADAADTQPFRFAENKVIGRVRDLPLDALLTQRFGDAEFSNVLSERVAQANTLSRYYGQDISPLTPEETSNVTRIVMEGDADTGTRILSQLSGTLDFASGQKLADSIASNDPVVGVAALLAPDSPEVTREILAGRGIDANAARAPVGDMRSVADEVIGEALSASPESRDAFIKAARSIYLRKSVQAGDTQDFNEDRFRRSLRLVLHGRTAQNGDIKGGPMSINGIRTLPPKPGVSQEDFQDAFRKLRDPVISAEVLARYANGIPGRLNRDGVLEQMPPFNVAEGKPIYVGRGRYMMRMDDGGYVSSLEPGTMEPTGEPLVIDFRTAFADSAFSGRTVTVSPEPRGPGGTAR